MSQQDTERTLPTIASSIGPACEQEELRLTVLFHPDTARIGQVARVPRGPGAAPSVLGRGSPLFSNPGSEPRALAEPHISRRALELEFSGNLLTLSRLKGSSRCRLDGAALFDSGTLDEETLRRGVPLMLSHCVVLMLRLVQVADEIDIDAPSDGDELIGRSAAMAKLRREITEIANADCDVLVRGESGSGKELVARAIHRASARAQGPLVSVNMAAIPEELAPAALFGSARGAFTGADRASPGYFRQASGGSLFLDEIGDAPSALQPQLLRVLQQREIQSVGGDIEAVDVRVISATDADLDDESRGFKAALRHRLGAIEVEVPPLREHPEDIGELLHHFLAAEAQALQRCALLPDKATPPAHIAVWANVFYLFSRYSYPGNVRELANLARQLLLDSRGEVPVISPRLLATLHANSDRGERVPATPQRRRMLDVPAEEFDEAMARHDYEIQSVARQLGVSRTSVYRRIEGSSRYRLATSVSRAELQERLTMAVGDLAAVARDLEVSLGSLRKVARSYSLDTR